MNVLPRRSSGARPPPRAPATSVAARAWSPRTDMRSASRITGTTSPPGTDTASPRWTAGRRQIVAPSVEALTSGNSTSAWATAWRTKSVTVNETPPALSSSRSARSRPASTATVTVKCGDVDPAARQPLGDDPAHPRHGDGLRVLRGRCGRCDGERAGEAARPVPPPAPAFPFDAARTSRSRIRPPGPDPVTDPRSIRRPAARAAARGLTGRRPAGVAGAGLASRRGAAATGAAPTRLAGELSATCTGVASAATIGADASGIASPGAPTHAQTAFTGTVSPSATTCRSSTPSSNDSTSIADLSVSISNRTSPRWTASPSALRHSRSVHSSVIWPGLGMSTGWAIDRSSLGRPRYPSASTAATMCRRRAGTPARGPPPGGRCRSAAPTRPTGRVEVVERLGLDPGDDLVDEAADEDRLAGHDAAAGLADRRQHGLDVQRHEAAQVDDLDARSRARPASRSAATSASGTAGPQATIVASEPSRGTRRHPDRDDTRRPRAPGLSWRRAPGSPRTAPGCWSGSRP